jgi:phosphatidylglycerophosphate synthase
LLFPLLTAAVAVSSAVMDMRLVDEAGVEVWPASATSNYDFFLLLLLPLLCLFLVSISPSSCAGSSLAFWIFFAESSSTFSRIFQRCATAWRASDSRSQCD